jgi:hypothetical protein
MATQPDDMLEDQIGDDNSIEVAEDDDQEVVDDQQQDEQPPADEEQDEIGWGGSAVAGEDESEGMRNLRNRLREIERENRALKGQPKQEEIGERPSLEDFGYDEEAHAEAVVAWAQRKAAAEDREKQQRAVAERQAARWSDQQRELDAGYADLRVPGKDAARAAVEEQFGGEQFAYLVKAGGKNSAAFLYALGNSPEKRQELKALADEGSWAEFIATAAVMAKEVTVQRRKPTTQPEQQHKGTSGAGAGNSDAKLAKLEKEAERTRNFTPLFEYKRQLRAAGKL